MPSPGDLPDPGLNPGLLHCRQILYHLSHQGSSSHTSSVQFSRSVMSDSLRPYELQHSRPPCPSPGVHPNSCPLSWRMCKSQLLLANREFSVCVCICIQSVEECPYLTVNKVFYHPVISSRYEVIFICL